MSFDEKTCGCGCSTPNAPHTTTEPVSVEMLQAENQRLRLTSEAIESGREHWRTRAERAEDRLAALIAERDSLAADLLFERQRRQTAEDEVERLQAALVNRTGQRDAARAEWEICRQELAALQAKLDAPGEPTNHIEYEVRAEDGTVINKQPLSRVEHAGRIIADDGWFSKRRAFQREVKTFTGPWVPVVEQETQS